MVPRVDVCELMMKCQNKHVLPFHILQQMNRLDVPVDSVEPENSSQTMPTRRITVKRTPNPLDRDEHPEKRTRGDDDHDSALLSVYQHDLGPGV